ncbi:MAG: carbohydrate kinase family protein [gamma proteobacterium symbiont of Taylorina sp.]|nr:carbohydrate kinase family protein [gamma proteobacterium symbiont of Taylorina sp.]
MTALICGSVAFDTIMVFHDHFKNHILPDKIHMLNVSFLAPDMRREFGGCAGNIAYTLNLLGGDVVPMATVGCDFSPYAEWMDKCGVSRKYLKVIDETYTGQAFITTDQDDNQITAFHPGAMGESHLNKVSDAAGITIGIVSPDGRDGMIEHARQFKEANIPFIFDPGQGMPLFGKDDLITFLEQATWLTVNDYEMQLLLDKTGLTPAEVSSYVDALIVTLGSEGAEIITQDKTFMIPVVEAKSIEDPTGCGDVFRSGLLYGLMNDLDWEITGRIASLLGSIKIEHNGTQNHSFTLEEFKARFQAEFGMTF